MERNMCPHLERQVNIEPSTLWEFEQKVRRDFKGFGPYPTNLLPLPLRATSLIPSDMSYQPGASALTPVFALGSQQVPSTPIHPR